MHPQYEKAHNWTREVIAAAIEVHRHMGGGLLESIYENCLCHELSLRGIPHASQVQIRYRYKDLNVEEPLRLDLLVDQCLVVELKSVADVLPVHKAQVLSYMKLLDVPLGLLINFNTILLKDGLHRLMLPGSSPT